MRFGVFLAPYHEPGQNPTLALERDLELIQLLDRLGLDEAWVGEHHSTGWETIASPELFLAVAAERTRHIRLGTGVVSLPYHHPLMVADRIVLLDHLTRGRVNFGVGPGGHLTDARMLGIEPARLRPMMAEALDVIVRLLTDPEPFSYRSDWFSLTDAVLQLRPYQDPHPPAGGHQHGVAGGDGARRAPRRRRAVAQRRTRAARADRPARALAGGRGGRRGGGPERAPGGVAPGRAGAPGRDPPSARSTRRATAAPPTCSTTPRA